VQREIKGLPPDMQARYVRIANLLKEFGPQQVGMPYVRPLGDKLWEMRLRGQAGIGRIIYIALPGQRLLLLHAFVK
jgi:phage-related protein